MKILIIDTETSGFKPPPFPASGIVEIGWIEVDAELEIIARHYSRVNPQCPIHQGASETHGIYDADVASSPLIGDIFKLKEPTLLVGHNIQFDFRFLKPWCDGLAVKTLCTLELARRLVHGSPNHKLGTLVTHFGIPQGKLHSALADAEMTLHLLRIMCGSVGKTALELAAQLDSGPQLLHLMPFGKHKGEPIVNVPDAYLKWLSAQDNLDPNLVHSLAHYLALKKL